MTNDEIKAALLEMDETLSENDETFQVAHMLLASTQIKPTIANLRELTGYGKGKCQMFLRNAKKAGVIKNYEVHHSGWFDDETGGVAFWMDVGCAQGFIERVAA